MALSLIGRVLLRAPGNTNRPSSCDGLEFVQNFSACRERGTMCGYLVFVHRIAPLGPVEINVCPFGMSQFTGAYKDQRRKTKRAPHRRECLRSHPSRARSWRMLWGLSSPRSVHPSTGGRAPRRSPDGSCCRSVRWLCVAKHLAAVSASPGGQFPVRRRFSIRRTAVSTSDAVTSAIGRPPIHGKMSRSKSRTIRSLWLAAHVAET